MRFKLLILVAMATALAGCPATCTETVTDIADSKPIKCTAEAFKNQGLGLIGPVNSCLVAPMAPPCLLGLIEPGFGITRDIVMCMVRRQGQEFHAKSQANTEDELSLKAADAARQFLVDEGVTFVDD